MVDKEYSTFLKPFGAYYSTTDLKISPALFKYSKFASVDNPGWLLRKKFLRERANGGTVWDKSSDKSSEFMRGVVNSVVEKWDLGNGKFQIASLRCEPFAIQGGSFHGPGGAPTGLKPGFVGIDPNQTANGLRIFWNRVFSTVPLPSEDQLLADAIAWGAKGLYRANRYKPRAHLATAMMELFTLRFNSLEVPHIPMGKFRYALQKGRAHEPIEKYIGQAGGEYLNIVFGWSPTIMDVRQLLDSQRNAAYLLDELQREEAKPYRFRKESSLDSYGIVRTDAGNLTTTSTSLPWYFRQGGLAAPSGCTISGTVRVKRWVSGAIVAAPLKSGSPRDVIRQIDYLYGAVPTPSAIWEAVPFSWLIDWQTNIGDVLSNISSMGVDGIAFKYAYSMLNYHFKGDVSDNFTLNDGERVTFPLEISVGCRVKATPFGFGVTAEQLNNKQWAILAALGLTKAFGKLP